MAAIAGDMHLLAYLIASEIAFGGEPRAQDVAEYRQVLHRLFRQIELEGQQGVRS